MNTKRMILWALVLTLVCWSGTAMAANSVVIPSQSVALGATGVVIPILITNDLELKGIIMPLALRAQTPGAFVTSITMAFADRLPAGGPLSEIAFRNQYAEEDGACKGGLAGGFGTISFNDGGPNPVVSSPEAVLFVRQKLFSPNLTVGTDATGSMVLTVDVTNVDGTFEIDTTCANPSNHLLFANAVGAGGTIPTFTKGIVTIGNPVSNNPPDAVCQDVSVDADADCLVDVDPAAVDNGSSDPDGDGFTFALNPPGPFGAGANSVWLVVTDDIGDKDSCQATITVNDVTNPVITSCPGDITVCPSNVPGADIGLVIATDNCGGVTITHEGDATDGGSCPEIITRTYRATDDAGNFVECTQTITVDDTENPVVTVCPAPVNIDCAADIPAPNTGLVTATDNCGTPAITFVSDVSDNLSCPETITRTYRATDLCGNTADCIQVITVLDTQAPELVGCPGDITVSCLADVPAAANVTAIDNCDGGIAADFAEVDNATGNPCGGTIVRTWSAVDACGNSAECSQTITVNDTENPVITCIGSQTAFVDANCEALLPDLTVDAVLTLTDNCTAPASIVVTQDPPSGTLLGTGTLQVTLFAEDACGNVAQCAFDYITEDNTPPTITCPANIAQAEDSPGAGAVVNFSAPTFDDNCPGASILQTAGDPSGSTFTVAGSPHTITFEVTDAAGLTNECSFTITVTEGIPPLVALCQDITVDADANCEAAVTPAQVDNGSSGSNITLSLDPPGPYGLGPNLVELVVTDDQSGEERCAATITVADNTPPTITCPSNITVQEDSPGAGAVVVYSNPPLDDNCPGVSATLIGGFPPGATFPLGTTTNTFEATDAAGNTAQCSFDVIVTEGAPALIALCQDVTVDADANCQAEVTPDQVDAGSSGSNITISLDPPGPYGLGANSVVLIVQDDLGGAETCDATITVEDNTPPSITCPSDITVDNEPGQCGAIVSFITTFDDNCPGATLDCVPASGSFFDVGTTTVTCTVTDAAGNMNECSFAVTVNDVEPPAAICPGDITVGPDPGQSGAVVNFTSTASDNCPGATIDCAPATGSFFPIGPTVVTCTATDAAGNTGTCAFTVTVAEGNNPPVALCADVTVAADDNCEADASIDGGSYDPDGDPITLSQDPPAPYPLGSTPVTLTVMDDQGGSSTCNATVTVIDDTPPEAICAGDITVTAPFGSGGMVVDYSSSATDNCPGATIDCAPASGSFFPTGQTAVVCTATDASGNVATCEFLVTVEEDVEPPTLSVAFSVTPGSCPGSFNANQQFNGNKGVLPVVILGTADFDVQDIDLSSLRLEGASPLRWNFGDFGTPPLDGSDDCPCASHAPDGIEDLMLKFSRAELIAAIGVVSSGEVIQIEITGTLLDGTPFSGVDCIRIVGLSASIDGDVVSTAEGLGTSNYPNPFNAGTTIAYRLGTAGHVNLSVFNILGQTVVTLVEGYQEAGEYTVEWTGTNASGQAVSSGMYFYRVATGELSETRKMLLLK